MITALQAVLLTGTVLALAAGQVLFKLAASRLSADGMSVPALFTNIPLWVALLVYGGATIAWLLLLRELPLSVAYPFVALAFFIVPLLSWLLLGEAISSSQWLGAALIVAGVWVSAR